MALSDSYASVGEYNEEAGSKDPSSDVVKARQLLAVSRYLDRESGQFFGQDAAPVARIFRGDGSCHLNVNVEGAPGIVSSTGLVIKIDEDDDGNFTEEVAIDNGTIHLLPFNAATRPEPEPYRLIELTSRSSPTSFPAGKLVQVTATYGYPAVPAAVKELTIKLAGIWRVEMPEATGRISELDQVVQSNPMALSLIKRLRTSYKRHLVG